MLAAGLLVVAHNSAGPKEDIIRDQEYLADSKEDYFTKITSILSKSDAEIIELSEKSRKKAISFAEE